MRPSGKAYITHWATSKVTCLLVGMLTLTLAVLSVIVCYDVLVLQVPESDYLLAEGCWQRPRQELPHKDHVSRLLLMNLPMQLSSQQLPAVARTRL
jgi:hypothetical protein